MERSGVDLGVTTYLDEEMLHGGLVANDVVVAAGSPPVDDYDASSLLSYSYRFA